MSEYDGVDYGFGKVISRTTFKCIMGLEYLLLLQLGFAVCQGVPNCKSQSRATPGTLSRHILPSANFLGSRKELIIDKATLLWKETSVKHISYVVCEPHPLSFHSSGCVVHHGICLKRILRSMMMQTSKEPLFKSRGHQLQ